MHTTLRMYQGTDIRMSRSSGDLAGQRRLVVVIASDQRSGTTELAHDLAMRLDALDLGEYFNPWGGQKTLPRRCPSNASLRITARAAHPLQSVVETRDACGYRVVIVRLFPLRWAGTLTSPERTPMELLSKDTHVLVLERNPWERFCSKRRAIATHDWLSRRETHPQCLYNASDESEWRAFLAAHRHWFARVRLAAVARAASALEVSFESIESRGREHRNVSGRNATIDAVVRWLGI